MERAGNDLYFTDGTITVTYYGFTLSLLRNWFCTCGINDFKKCMKTLKWACSDNPPSFNAVIDCVDRSIKYSCPEVVTISFDKKMKVLSKYRKEYLNYEF
jgi:hypothetical protein